MLGTLLESNSRKDRSVGGALVSVTAHTALIAAAVYATAQARIQPGRMPETVRPVYFPSVPKPARLPALAAPTALAQQRSDRPTIYFDPRVDIKIPPIDVAGLASQPGDFTPRQVGGDVSSTGGGSLGAPAGTPLLAEQVEKQVTVAAGNPPPRYPEVLRSSGVEGRVVAVFIVDEAGRAEEGSVRFTHSDNQLFEEAVRVALRRLRFNPAEIGGRKVRQLVQMPFVFSLAR
jgi:protein TonB